MKKHNYNKLFTEAGERLLGDPTRIPWDEYPRPHLKRREWLNLNGLWEFRTESGSGGSIRVPFPVESPLSGYDGELRYGEKLTYKRKFTLPAQWLENRRPVLYIGAVSRKSDVFVNGHKVGAGTGAYSTVYCPLDGFVTAGENELVVECVNDLDPAFPYGKQRIKRGGMWYTPCSGIWQTVWIEPIPKGPYISEIECKQSGNEQRIRVYGVLEGEVVCGGRTYPLTPVREGGSGRSECTIRIDEPRLWSPEEPCLYEFTVKTANDEAESYFAFRTVETKTVGGAPRLCLNGRPYFFNGLLDQGYYSDGLWTPAEPMEYARDILKMKSLGFNMLRKHIKCEPELFYYYCDKLGMAVFQDMVNNGRYRFLRDTLLPTLGITRLKDARMNRDKRARSVFLTDMCGTARELDRHPSVVCWTVFNEGWGQFNADEAYEKLKAADPTRLIDAASGWFRQKKTDMDSLHIYFKRLRMGKRSELPQVVSEFGGYVWKVEGHSFDPRKTYGYRLFKNREEFVRGVRRLYLEELLPLAEKGLSAAVYTQVSDVEDETNGILTFDRRVMKLAPSEMLPLSEALKNAAQGERRSNSALLAQEPTRRV